MSQSSLLVIVGAVLILFGGIDAFMVGWCVWAIVVLLLTLKEKLEK